jgi:chromosome segregation ATPase
MIEWAMLFALGFCTAGLIALLAIPAIWRRAEKVTSKRIRGALPISVGELQAEKDQLRAEFAMSARKLESSVDGLKDRMAESKTVIGKKDELIRKLRGDVSARRKVEEDLHSRIETMQSEIKRLEKTIQTNEEVLKSRDSSLNERDNNLMRKARELADATALADTRRVEIVALETKLQSINASLEERNAALEKRDSAMVDRDEQIGGLQRDLSETKASLTSREAEVKRLRKSIERQEETIAAHEADLENLRRAIKAERASVEQKSRELSDAERLISERTGEAGRLAAQLARAKKPGDADENGKGHDLNPAAVADSVLNKEQRENALLREKLNDLTAQVIGLTASLDDDGEIADMARNIATSGDTAEMSSLADRIRALQNRAS